MTGRAWDDELGFAERAVARMEGALSRLDPYQPVTPAIAAVFCVSLPPIDGSELWPEQRARLGNVIQRLDDVRFALAARQKRVGGRLQAVSSSLGRGTSLAAQIDQAV